MDQASIDHIKGIIEALLFVSEKPVTLQQIKEVSDGVSAGDIRKVIDVLKDEYDERKSGMTIVELAGGYQMLSSSNYASYIRAFYKTKHKQKLSKPALETLAIIAYKQPVTRADIEIIRGVNSDGVTSHLLDKELIKIVGKKDIPGRPYLYGTTKLFLDYFGLRSLDDLPKLEDFPRAVKQMEEMVEKADQRDEQAAREKEEESENPNEASTDEAEQNDKDNSVEAPDLKKAMAEVEEEIKDEEIGNEIVNEIEKKLSADEDVSGEEPVSSESTSSGENEPK